MKHFMVVLLPVLISLTRINAINLLQNNVVKVSLFYEAMCPHSIRFIKEQIIEVDEKLSKYVILDLIPFGRAQMELVDNSIKFTCKNGPIECYANEIHICAMEQLNIRGRNSLLKFIRCLFHTNYSDSELNSCCKQIGFDYHRLKRCMVTMANNEFAKYGRITQQAFPQGINFIPIIMINDYFNKTLDLEATENLLKTVCKFFKRTPKKCNGEGF